MNDLGKALLSKVDMIIDAWVEEVRQTMEIDETQGLTYESVHNGLPDVLESVATLLTTALVDEEEEVEEGALGHGAVRAEQGFDIAEVVREYRILRNVLLVVLEPDLQTGSVTEVITAMRKIDAALDDVVLLSIESYISHRLSLLEKMHAQLLLTNQELIRLVEVQKDNVSHLAHELKNPLNSIIGFSSILLRKQRQQLSNQSAASMDMQQIERILNNGQQLLRLINNTLEASRQDSAQLSLNLEVIEVSTLVKMVSSAMVSSAESKGLEMRIDCDRAPERVSTDSLRLQQILTNLISNAVRYTDEGSVSIRCYQVNEQQWAIAVCDTGQGISPEQQPRIFEPYFRGGNEKDYLPESNGLGLTIVQKLVRLLQGELDLFSEVGQGSTFTVLLPMQLEEA
ncbi:MAG: HAMP domain-containing sensor histidine kinase [Phormidesmis sp.]